MKRRTKRALLVLGLGLAAGLAAAFLGVDYFMGATYEVERDLHLIEVPAQVLVSFRERFPGADGVEWEQDDEKFEANFHQDGQSLEAYFLEDGTWTKTEYGRFRDPLPQPAVDYLDGLEDSRVKAIKRVALRASPAVYEVEVEGPLQKWECLFDRDGNLVRKSRDGLAVEDDDS